MTNGNLTTEQDYSLTCNVCAGVQTVRVCTVRKDKYLRGAMVQDVFPEPEFDSAYREQIIGLRSGYHVCDNCWSSVFAEEEITYTVWVGGVPDVEGVTDVKAQEVYDEWVSKGYDDVRIVED